MIGQKRGIVEVNPPIPLVGCIAFGLIDRGTNLIQVRPISTCPLSCVFCSTNAGPKSTIRQTEYIVPLDYLVEGFRRLVRFKGEKNIEAHVDTVGDPLTYPKIVELIHELKNVKGVETISMQTHGFLLNEKILDRLSDAGLSRINLSIDALNPKLARWLSNTENYDVGRIIELAKYMVENTAIDLLLAPVWIPTINDEEIPKIVELAIKIGAGKHYPPLGIQKYEIHRYGRKLKKVKTFTWKTFYDKLREMEKTYRVKLVLNPKDFGIYKLPMLPTPYRRLEKVKLRIVGEGWLKGEKLALPPNQDRVFTLIKANHIPLNSTVKARVLRVKHNIYLAEPIP